MDFTHTINDGLNVPEIDNMEVRLLAGNKYRLRIPAGKLNFIFFSFLPSFTQITSQPENI
jgi:hypothetical protein